MLCTGCWVPVGRHDPCRRCKSVHTVTRRDEVITPYGSRPDTQGNNHNRPAAHCYARQITGAQSCGKKKKESADLQSTLSSFLAANATLSGAKESWGVARGDRKPWCPVPFCPRRRVAAKLRPLRAPPRPPVGDIPRLLQLMLQHRHNRLSALMIELGGLRAVTASSQTPPR